MYKHISQSQGQNAGTNFIVRFVLFNDAVSKVTVISVVFYGSGGDELERHQCSKFRCFVGRDTV
jgi:hypothetical protein